MRTALAGSIVAGLLLAGAPATAAVGYTARIEQPEPGPEGTRDVRGITDVVVRVSGGVGDATTAAYHLRPGGPWSEAERVPLERTAEDRFEGTLDTTGVPNDAYELEARVWGDVPPYRPGNPGTYASEVVTVRVDNPPPAPGAPSATATAGAVRLIWPSVETAGRSDFAGYRVWGRRGSACPGAISAYEQLAETTDTSHTTTIAPGGYCFRVAAVRTSPVAGTISSAPSPPVRIGVPASAGSVASAGAAAGPPPPPGLAEGESVVPDGGFGERLPYGPRTVRSGDEVAEEALRELGPDPRATPLAVAAGLLLLVAAFHLRRFLRREAPGRPVPR